MIVDRAAALCRLATMVNEPRLSLQTLTVLQVFLEHPQDQFSGADLLRLTGLASGTLYPLLLRLEQAGWLESDWEDVDPRTAGRPRRRYYRVTATGVRKAERALRAIKPTAGRPAWA